MNRLAYMGTLLCASCLLVSNAWVIPQSTSAAVGRTPTNGSRMIPPLSQHLPFSTTLQMANDAEQSKKNNLPFWLDIGTKGGAVFWSLVLFIVPIIGYNEIEAGKWIGVGFTAIAMLAWSSTYLFRVATKDMTYVSFPGMIKWEEVEGLFCSPTHSCISSCHFYQSLGDRPSN